MLAFLFLAFLAAFAVFSFAKARLKTPLLFNLLGSFFVWAAVFSLGAAFGRSTGPWSSIDGEPLGQSPYMVALQYLALAALAYGVAFLLQRAIAKRNKPSDRT